MAGTPREVFRPVGWRPGAVLNYYCDTCHREFQSNIVGLKDCVYCTERISPEIWQPMDIAEALNKHQSVTVKHLIPEWRLIPDTYKGGHPYAKLANEWYINGLGPGVSFTAKPGIDATKAFYHIRNIFAVDGVKREHKIAAAAYLLAQWFDKFDFEEGRR